MCPRGRGSECADIAGVVHDVTGRSPPTAALSRKGCEMGLVNWDGARYKDSAMPTVLNEPQAIEDFVTGLAFFGTGGGGGRLEDGIEMLMPMIRAGQGITLVGPDE